VLGLLLLSGCATVSYTSDGKPVTVRAVGYDFTVPTNPPLTFTANKDAIAATQGGVEKALDIGGEALANHALDKAAEAQKGAQ
jgi:hypothetical protein